MQRLRLLLAGLPAALAVWSDGDIGFDRWNADITSFTLRTNTTLECYNACAAQANCVAWSMQPSGPACGGVNATCWLKDALNAGPLILNPCRISGPMPSTFMGARFATLPVGSVTPTGWLANELLLQSSGLAGYLIDFWADVQNSVWLGGNADGGLHERGPYWLNGMTPLAFQLGAAGNASEQERVSAQVESYINSILSHAAPSGWLGPDDMPTDGDQYWSRFNVLHSLVQWWEGGGGRDTRIMPAVFAFIAEARRRMLGSGENHDGAVLLSDWAVVRAQDFINVLWYLTDNFNVIATQLPQGRYSEAFLVDTADVVHAQMLSNGGDWKTWFDTDGFPTGPACTNGAPCDMMTHGVNIAQAIKSEAVWYRRSGDQTDVDSTYIRMHKLDTYHGAPSGVLQADEHLAGSRPSQGTELCGVVEASFSYTVAGDVIGDALFFERAEEIAYNALPATMTKNLWAHQYLQQSNEINAKVSTPRVWFTDGPDSTLFGLQPNYGCCTANFPQGWPKFAQRSIKAVLGQDGFTATGVAVAMWAPVEATVTLLDFGSVLVNVTTSYPFSDSATVAVTASVAGMPVSLRVPSWATGATLAINGEPAVPIGASNGSFYTLQLPLAGLNTLQVNFNPSIRLERWYNGTIAVKRGALLYALQLGENFTTLATYAYQSADYQVLPTTPWNYALLIEDLANPAASLTFEQLLPEPSSTPYATDAPPVVIRAQGRQVLEWTEQDNAAAPPPASPACTASGACGPLEAITLVPFGSTHLRVSQMPYTSS